MKIELHTHSKEISTCGHLSIDELLSLYKKAEYDVVVITNHFSTATANYWQARGIKDFHRAYFDCLEYAENAGRKSGICVLPGCELRFDSSDNDYLVYGMNAEMCRDWRDICAMTEKEFKNFADEHDILFYQAHPFRNGMKVVNPQYLHGIETQNTHPRHDSRNDIAALWAKKFNLPGIAGSDCHQKQDAGTSAILTEYKIEKIEDLLYILKNNLYKIL